MAGKDIANRRGKCEISEKVNWSEEAGWRRRSGNQACGQVLVLLLGLKLGSSTEFSILLLGLELDIYVEKYTCTCNFSMSMY